jgi:branched-chain amino acid transport system substrate-binding protein
MTRATLASLLTATLLAAAPLAAQAQSAPTEIKIGHLHAGSGAFAAISMPVYSGLKLWADQVNAQGGVMVKPFGKKIPVRLVEYDDQSNTSTAATLYNQLITQDHVDMLVADSGSVLTSVAVPIAKEHKMFLFDPTGTGATFFQDNPYIALLADPVSTIWPKYIADYLGDDGLKAGIKKIAILYSTNDFTGTQATALRGFIKTHPGLEIVYDQGVPTSTSNYTTLISNIQNAAPDAVIELGYTGNDIAFLRNLQDSGSEFRMVFAIYPGIETEELMKNVGPAGLKGVFSYVTSAAIDYKPDFGMSAGELRDAWRRAYPDGQVHFGFNAIAGYMSGLVLQRTLETTEGMSQDALGHAVFALSGKLNTLDGPFVLDEHGAQVGEITPLGQFQGEGREMKLQVVYPHDLANGAKAVLGAK